MIWLGLLFTLIACKPAHPPGPTDDPIETGVPTDTSPPTDATVYTAEWVFARDVRTGEQGRQSHAADQVVIINTSPLLIGFGVPGAYIKDWNIVAEADVMAIDLAMGEWNVTRRVSATTFGGRIPVTAPGDLSGDAIADFACGLRVISGPLETTPIQTFEIDPPLLGLDLEACDANLDGAPDLCGTWGVHLGPLDGTIDIFWELPAPGQIPPDGWLERIAIAHSPSATIGLVTFPPASVPTHIVAVPLALTGELDLTTFPSWTVPDGFVFHEIETYDLDRDGTDEALVCASDAGQPGLYHFDDFPNPPVLVKSLPDPCEALEINDFDGDGRFEFAVGGNSRVRVYDDDWTLLATHRGNLDPLADGLGKALDSADIDGDGRADLLVGAPDISRLYLTLNAIGP